MAVDTANKRRSIISLDLAGAAGPGPIPDGGISSADRRHLSGLYAGFSIVSQFIFPSSISTSEILGTPEVSKTTQPQSSISLAPEISKDGDIRIGFDVRDQYADLILGDRDVDRDGGFETAILITLLTDKRADEGDPLPDEGGYKGGWWGDSIPVVADYKMGTKLWLLQRSKTIEEVPAQAEEYLKDGFQWMLDDGIIESMTVSAQRVDADNGSILMISLAFKRPEGQTVFYKFYYNWQTQILRRQ